MDTITKTTVREAIIDLVTWINAAEASFKELHFPMLEADIYYICGGRKYVKIAHGNQVQVERSGGSVHCFIDAVTGDVYKPGSWKAPALNGSRFNILDSASLADFKAKWDPYGGYLYKNRY